MGICGSGAGTLGGGGDSPALGSGLQLPVQGHREAKEAPRLAFLAEGAHHVQVEGGSPGEEQSGDQGAKKVTNPRGPPRIAARSSRHGATPARAPGEGWEIRWRPESQISRGGSLVSESRWPFRGSSQSSTSLPSTPLPPPQHRPGRLQRPQPRVPPGPASAPAGAAPAPPSPRPPRPAAGGGRRESRRDAQEGGSG